MEALPISLNLKQLPVLVVGGGDIGYRKIQTLIKAQAKVTVVARKVSDKVQALASQQVKIVVSEYSQTCLTKQRLVIAATDDHQLNQQIADDAKTNGVLINVVDTPHLCDFTFPAIVDRSPVVIAISSNGSAPVLVRKWKEKLETLAPRWLGKFAQLAGDYREKVQSSLSNFNQRRYFWEDFFGRDSESLAAAGNWHQLQKKLDVNLQQAQTGEPKQGHVYLVGGGPGDPDLLTIKALQIMQSADVIVYDALISQPILDLCRKDADYINVGKHAGNRTLPQEGINQLLVDLAKQGKQVCRLKGGDPYIYGRGGEEAAHLAANQQTFTTVPGITAAAACSASADIPLTHRDYAQSLQFVTGHCKNSDGVQGAKAHGPNWKSLATARQTLVVYMGILRSKDIKQQLINHGRAPETPVAIVEKGTRPDQRVVIGTLNQLDELVNQHKIGSPALVIIGEVVALHQQLQVSQPSPLQPIIEQAA